MSRQVAHNFTAASGVAHVDGALEIKMRYHCCQVVGVVVHIVSFPNLRRAAMATPIMGNDAIALG
ncbi:hypothetical protein D3C81_1004840 [compost metagenome]